MEKLIINKNNINNTFPHMENVFNYMFTNKSQIVGIDIGSPLLSEKNLNIHSFPLDFIVGVGGMKYHQQFSDHQFFITDKDYNLEKDQWDEILLNENCCIFLAIGEYIENPQEMIEIFLDDIKNYGFNFNKEIVVIKSTLSNKNMKENDLITVFANEIFKFTSKFQK